MYLVTHEHGVYGTFFHDPVCYRTLSEAEDYAKKQAVEHHVNGYVYVVYDCNMVSQHGGNGVVQ